MPHELLQCDQAARVLLVELDGERGSERVRVCGDPRAAGNAFDDRVDDLRAPYRLARRPAVRDHVVARTEPDARLLSLQAECEKFVGERFPDHLVPLLLEAHEAAFEVEVFAAQPGERSPARPEVAGEGDAEQLVPAVTSGEEPGHVAAGGRDDVDVLRARPPRAVDRIHRVRTALDNPLLLEKAVVAAQHRDVERQGRARNRGPRLCLPATRRARLEIGVEEGAAVVRRRLGRRAAETLHVRATAKGSLASTTNYTTSYTYDAADQLTGETDPAGHTYSFFYDNRGNLRGTQYPNGTFSWVDTNPDGWINDQYSRHGTITASTTNPPADSNPLVDFTYTYDLDGKRQSETRQSGSNSQTTTYNYDNLGRLSQLVLPNGTCRDYSYDLDSNRISLETYSTSTCTGTPSTTTTYSYDPTNSNSLGVDELTSINQGQTTYSYTSDGQTSNQGTTSYTWDGWNRVKTATVGSNTVTYTYDPTGALKTRATSSLELTRLC